MKIGNKEFVDECPECSTNLFKMPCGRLINESNTYENKN